MKKLLRRLVPPLLTLLFTAAAVLLPPAFSRLRDSLTLSGVHVEETTLVPEASALTTEEKLELICRYRRDPGGVIQSTQDFGDSRGGEVTQMAQKSVKRLSELGLFSPGTGEEPLRCEAAAMTTYTDPSDLSRTVSVWDASFATGEWLLSVTLDMESGQLYEFSAVPLLESSFAVGDDSTVMLGGDPGELSNAEDALRGFVSDLDLTLEKARYEDAASTWMASVSGASFSFLFHRGESTVLSLRF